MRIVLVAGEASGDVLGASLIRALRVRHQDLQLEGIAGPRMQAEGCSTVYPLERLSVNGLFESFGRYPELIPLRNRMARGYSENSPDVFVGIDAPDFNIELALKLKRAGVRTVHYVSPSVWAWRRYRLPKIARAVDCMLTLFPFEQRFYAEHRISARFVGHPLADEIDLYPDREAARESLGLNPQARIVTVLPGSRDSEVAMLGEVLIKTIDWLHSRDRALEFVIPAARPAFAAGLRQIAARLAPDASIHFLHGDSHRAMSAADCVLLASGTATLEAMLLKRPMVITYRTSRLTWAIGRRMLHVDHVGLPNLLAGRELVPELLQDAASPDRLGAAVLAQLNATQQHKNELQRSFEQIHRQLRRGASDQAAQSILALALHGKTSTDVCTTPEDPAPCGAGEQAGLATIAAPGGKRAE